MATLLQQVLRRRSHRLSHAALCCSQFWACSDRAALGWQLGRPPTASLNALSNPGGLSRVRGFSEELRVVAAILREPDYHQVADEALEGLAERLEAYVEENDVDGGDVEYSQGVLTVKLGSLGTFVINKQTPNRQIWLSSPVSGPFRYDLADGRWIYNRDGRDLVRQLEEEIGNLVGSKLQLE